MSVNTNVRCVTYQKREDLKFLLAGAKSNIGRVYIYKRFFVFPKTVFRKPKSIIEIENNVFLFSLELI